ncbi:MAG TPA: 23S rRNA (pseudouridine(1915)-N(3))-methyltransferase RlmH [Bacteroidales bacterium]|nr:23S rRNA (pseudouridine(1915)-N(3))-methyltransferase RlmH [Bacteroidales bacterium]HNR41099.1 23S rRNA (pseudouridine(1915)-N(3))-methyltransferase RlmH [Bacteroidales bacterium]HPM17665.1 23S rRNA (pseudouridine(1915)-N(3))-methyltransferase RlmH [Bacteroidales bacterium]HQG78445.1 23S rRNA (pseudouridine(1915)-N(3))-methyltransferase RlmH [Bacteroidales bacterium]
MKIVLLQTGKTTEEYIDEGVGNYSARIRKFTPFEIVTLPELKNTRYMPVKEQKDREGAKMLQYLQKEDYIIVLDENGQEYTTHEFAGKLEKLFMLQKKRIVFVIGGAYGLAGDVLDRADLRLSLSKMTFSHQVVRLLFAEQLYRAFTVIKGEPYHHD